MLSFKRSISYILFIIIILSALSACSSDKTNTNVKPEDMLTLPSGDVDSRDDYTLSWNSERISVLLKNGKTGNIWSTVPYDFLLGEDTNINLNAPMFISYYNPSDSSLMVAKAYADCIELNNFSVESQEGKIKMEFYFEAAEITVPLEISLTKNGMQASVKASEIKESGKTWLIDVSILPYLCSTPNSKDKSSYLFVPAGSGALLYTDEDVQEFSRGYTGEVYGTDAARHILDNTTKEEPIRLPVYGVKNKDSALFAIISSGAETAKITADAGNSRNGYSTVYATFSVRGNDETEIERTNYSDALIYSETFNKNMVYTIDYYPLSGNEATYSGMAGFYKNYLKEKGALRDSELSQQPYQLTFLGGSLVRDVAVGIPYMRMQPATKIIDAQNIIKELKKETGNTPAVVLRGYSQDGLDIGRIAGGYGLASKLGGEKAFKSFDEYCRTNGINLFTEVDVVRFNSSANGFSTSFDIAKTAGKQLAAFYPLRVNIRNENDTLKKYGLLQRSLLEDAVDKLINKCDHLSGISFTTMGSLAYSDFSSEEYYVKANMSTQVKELIEKVQSKGHLVNTGAANGYAAQVSDSITEVPLSHGNYFAFDKVVPFYQMVFHGNSTLYSTYINLSDNPDEVILRAIESGVSPSFVLSSQVDKTLADTQSPEYYASLYKGNREYIINIISKTADYFSYIGDSEIISHRILSDNITLTEFSNGASVWVNHSEGSEKIDGVTLDKMSFCYNKDGKVHSISLAGGEQ